MTLLSVSSASRATAISRLTALRAPPTATYESSGSACAIRASGTALPRSRNCKLELAGPSTLSVLWVGPIVVAA